MQPGIERLEWKILKTMIKSRPHTELSSLYSILVVTCYYFINKTILDQRKYSRHGRLLKKLTTVLISLPPTLYKTLSATKARTTGMIRVLEWQVLLTEITAPHSPHQMLPDLITVSRIWFIPAGELYLRGSAVKIRGIIW